MSISRRWPFIAYTSAALSCDDAFHGLVAEASNADRASTTKKSERFPSLVFLFATLIAPPLLGQPVSPNFGTATTSTYSIGACDVKDMSGNASFPTNDCAYVTTADTGSPTVAELGFPVHLPTGVLITSIKTYYFNNNSIAHPSLRLSKASVTGVATQVVDLSPSSNDGGATSFTVNLAPPHQVDDLNFSYSILAAISSNSGAGLRQAIYKFDVNYMLQVSPAPATATFGDVPTSSPQFQFVEALVAAGITAGCGGGNYCPTSPVTRGQMAVFLAKALGLNFPN